jgi:hypothetical protein
MDNQLTIQCFWGIVLKLECVDCVLELPDVVFLHLVVALPRALPPPAHLRWNDRRRRSRTLLNG